MAKRQIPVADPGEGWEGGGGRSPLSLDDTEVRSRKNFFGDRPAPPIWVWIHH